MTALERFCPYPEIGLNGEVVKNPQYEKVYGKWGYKRWLRYLKEPWMWWPVLKQLKKQIVFKLTGKWPYESKRTQSVPRG